jgi:hypothetical protein
MLPPEAEEVQRLMAEYLVKTAGEQPFQLFGKNVIPYPKSDVRFWWAVLLATRRMDLQSEEKLALLQGSDVNKSGTPREECLLMRDALDKRSWDVEWMFDDILPEKELTIVQIDSTSNFLDRRVYTKKEMLQWKFAEYAYNNALVRHISEVPIFLDYRLNVFGNTAARCVQLQHKIHLRNSPGNLLTIDKKALEAPVDIHGKVFVVGEGRDLEPEEIFEIVIFCMGQAETTELRLKSWGQLREVLTDEARKFMKSAQHLRARPRIQAA